MRTLKVVWGLLSIGILIGAAVAVLVMAYITRYGVIAGLALSACIIAVAAVAGFGAPHGIAAVTDWLSAREQDR